MESFKDMCITQMNREAEALEKLYKLQYTVAERYGIEHLHLFSSHLPDRLLNCVYFWLALKSHEVWEEKYPTRVIWTYRDRRLVITVAENKVLCDDTPVTSFSEFLDWYDRMKNKHAFC